MPPPSPQMINTCIPALRRIILTLWRGDIQLEVDGEGGGGIGANLIQCRSLLKGLSPSWEMLRWRIFEKTHRHLQHLDVADSRTPPAQRNHKLMDTPLIHRHPNLMDPPLMVTTHTRTTLMYPAHGSLDAQITLTRRQLWLTDTLAHGDPRSHKYRHNKKWTLYIHQYVDQCSVGT